MAGLRLLAADEPVWGPQPANAAYLHGLVVDRRHVGEELGAALLSWAERHARAAGPSYLRLDCLASNTTLRSYYAAAGFEEAGYRDFDSLWRTLARLEKRPGLGCQLCWQGVGGAPAAGDRAPGPAAVAARGRGRAVGGVERPAGLALCRRRGAAGAGADRAGSGAAIADVPGPWLVGAAGVAAQRRAGAGECGLYPWRQDGRETGDVELGYRFGREHWGQGYAGEAARAVLDWASGELGFTELVCVVQEANTASRRIAVDQGQVPGVVAAVARGTTVHVACAGVMTVGGAQRDTLFRIASITKPMTAAVVLSLVASPVCWI